MATEKDRTTERRLVAARAIMGAAPDASRDVTGEDFLFHLYRGSELLQDNRVHEAKEELEQALTLQPRDPKGQDLLAVVYFRIGLYPRAIQIYEELQRDNPKDIALKLNLALCYLKTGQAQAARTALEEVVQAQPGHKRAWGYLGLAHERLGDLEKAVSAFERGGHVAMVRRVAMLIGANNRHTPAVHGPQAELARAAAAAFEELDAGEISFSLAAPALSGAPEVGSWKAVDIGDLRRPAVVLPTPAREWAVTPTLPPMVPVNARAVASLRDDELHASQAPRSSQPLTAQPPTSLAEIARASLLLFPRAAGVSLHASGFALVRTTGNGDGRDGHSFAARLESIRSQAGPVTTELMQRRTRGKANGESFGGLGSPLVRLTGAGEIVLGARGSHRLVAFTLHDDTVFVREEVLLGFELTLEYDNGKLALGDGDAAPVVQLRGTGGVVLEVVQTFASVEVQESRPTLARHEIVIGWTGRVFPRALAPSEAPHGQRGLVSFTGDGSLLVATR